ncbi:MAG: hypothetical protein Q7R95_11375 [bacterium]|nr:hypothetical protein [bacterium]
MICSSDIYYQNTDFKQNFSKVSGKEFCIFFKKDKVFQLYKDGSSKLIYENRPNDQAVMENGLKTNQIKRVNLKEFIDESGQMFYSRN